MDVIFFKKGNTHFGLISKTKIDQNTFLKENERKDIIKITHPERIIEFKGIRQLRNKLIPDADIFYDSNGKPKTSLKDTHISISHSVSSVLMGVSTVPIGIDIEEIHPRILKVQSKFVHPEESINYSCDMMEDLTLLWTLKESVYKLCGIPGLHFKNGIRAIERSGNKHKCIVPLDSGALEFYFEHERIDNEIITYNCT